jgi:hypothetical protein
MSGVGLIPGFAVFCNRILQCFKCGHMEGLYPEVERRQAPACDFTDCVIPDIRVVRWTYSVAGHPRLADLRNTALRFCVEGL